MSSPDVLIVGAGPAGSALAIRLAKRGFGVVLCEQRQFPREKLCGEFLSPEGVGYLHDLGMDHPGSTHGAPSIRQVVIANTRGEEIRRRFDVPAFGFSRGVLDDDLVGLARDEGADWRPGCRVVSIRTDGDGFLVGRLIGGTRHDMRVRAVIDAGGRGGGVGPASRRSRRHARVAFKRHLRVPALTGDDASTVHVSAFDGGYLGVAPVEGNRLNLCFLIEKRLLKEMGDAEHVLADIARRFPRVRDQLASGTSTSDGFLSTANIEFGPVPSDTVALRIGDAMGMIAPLAGDGISMALHSAELAEGVVAGYLDGACSWERTRSKYRDIWSRAFRRRLHVAGALHHALTKPGPGRVLMAATTRHPPIADWFIRQTRA